MGENYKKKVFDNGLNQKMVKRTIGGTAIMVLFIIVLYSPLYCADKAEKTKQQLKKDYDEIPPSSEQQKLDKKKKDKRRDDKKQKKEDKIKKDKIDADTISAEKKKDKKEKIRRKDRKKDRKKERKKQKKKRRKGACKV